MFSDSPNWVYEISLRNTAFFLRSLFPRNKRITTRCTQKKKKDKMGENQAKLNKTKHIYTNFYKISIHGKCEYLKPSSSYTSFTCNIFFITNLSQFLPSVLFPFLSSFQPIPPSPPPHPPLTNTLPSPSHLSVPFPKLRY